MMLEVAAVEEAVTSGKRERPENRFGQFERVRKRVALGAKTYPAQEA
jgi:hypothetical protein